MSAQLTYRPTSRYDVVFRTEVKTARVRKREYNTETQKYELRYFRIKHRYACVGIGPIVFRFSLSRDKQSILCHDSRCLERNAVGMFEKPRMPIDSIRYGSSGTVVSEMKRLTDEQTAQQLMRNVQNYLVGDIRQG